jgi:uncharacterized protein (DUF427 family)
MTIQAIWNDTIVAESEDTIVVEGNHYFPIDDVKMEFLEESTTHTVCPWKGTASYYSIVVNRKRKPDAAWYYPNPTSLAKEVAGRIAFWRGVKVTRSDFGSAEEAGRRKLPHRSA